MSITNPPRVQFGKYLLLDRINVGGMAEVWRGKTAGLTGKDQLVAIKRILPSIAEDSEFVAMFIDEAKITVQLTHPNIGQVFELGQISGSYFITMEYIPSKDLRSIFDHSRRLGEPAPTELSCYVVSLMCDALDHAHRKIDHQGRPMNIIHRDVSPQNILITFEGDVKVIDFGIAKAAGRASRTQAGILKGKFAYMSPEQVGQTEIDHRSDIFSIGTCFHEILTSERLFAGDSDFSILDKVRRADVAAPSKINPRVPAEVDRIALRALAREPSARYQFASEMADDLRKYLSSSSAQFGPTQLAQYMAATFSEELEAERARLRRYAEIRVDLQPPERKIDSFAIRRANRPSSGGFRAPENPLDSSPAEYETLEGHPLRDPRTDPGLFPDTLRPSPPSSQQPPGNVHRVPATFVPKAPHNTQRPNSLNGADSVRRSSGTESPKISSERVVPAQRKLALQAVVAFLGGAALASLLFLGPWRQPKGFLLIDVPQGLRSKAKITVNGIALGAPSAWPVLRSFPVGPVIVLITADGFETFTAAAKVQAGDAVARINARLRPTAAFGHLIIVTEPESAEIRIDGEIVRSEGDSSNDYVAELVVRRDYEIEVRHAGFRPLVQKVSVPTVADPVRLIARLEVQR